MKIFKNTLLADQLRDGIMTAAHIMKCSLTFTDVERENCVTSYLSCFLTAFVPAIVSIILVTLHNIFTKGVVFIKSIDYLKDSSLALVLFIICTVALCYLTSVGNCTVLGLSYSALEVNIVLGIAIYLPVLVIARYMHHMVNSLVKYVYLIMNAYFIRSNYGYIGFKGEREAIFYYVFVLSSIFIISFIVPLATNVSYEGLVLKIKNLKK